MTNTRSTVHNELNMGTHFLTLVVDGSVPSHMRHMPKSGPGRCYYFVRLYAKNFRVTSFPDGKLMGKLCIYDVLTISATVNMNEH